MVSLHFSSYYVLIKTYSVLKRHYLNATGWLLLYAEIQKFGSIPAYVDNAEKYIQQFFQSKMENFSGLSINASLRKNIVQIMI